MQQRDIHERIYRFVLEVIKLTNKLPKTTANIIIVRQVIRSASSIGANGLEAEGASSKKEFIHTFTISKREAKETEYWLSLIKDTNIEFKPQLELLMKEVDEIIRIISAIILNSKRNSVI